MAMNDRIKLAEAMNPNWDVLGMDGDDRLSYRDKDTGCVVLAECIDPFTDANDDYAVLEWMRNNDEPLAGLALCNPMADYKIGDYARAALKVIDGD